MVKNNLGGNKAKGFARKNMVKRDTALRVAQEDGEIYAQAVKIMGGCIASAIDIHGNPLRAHIRGKFRGRGKRDNFIEPGTWLLVGLHSWETDKSTSKEIRNCDVLEVYSDSDKNRLKTSVTSINWSKFIENDNKSTGNESKDDELGVVFADEATQEYEELIANQATTASSVFVVDDGEVINVDDI
jgi:hypothetical protein